MSWWQDLVLWGQSIKSLMSSSNAPASSLLTNFCSCISAIPTAIWSGIKYRALWPSFLVCGFFCLIHAINFWIVFVMSGAAWQMVWCRRWNTFSIVTWQLWYTSMRGDSLIMWSSVLFGPPPWNMTCYPSLFVFVMSIYVCSPLYTNCSTQQPSQLHKKHMACRLGCIVSSPALYYWFEHIDNLCFQWDKNPHLKASG